MERVTLELTAEDAQTLRRRTGTTSTRAAIKAALGPLTGNYSPRFRRALRESLLDEKSGRIRRFKTARAMVDALYK